MGLGVRDKMTKEEIKRLMNFEGDAASKESEEDEGNSREKEDAEGRE